MFNKDEHIHCWSTEESHTDNSETMNDYLDFEMDQSWSVDLIDGTYAEVTTDCGIRYEVYVSGDGDSFNHMAKLVRID